ncbi:MAG: hypothetical protein EHM58_03075 [Ignavibacteriae bacterium]|nr:MAG: hypothetical protein EHM58_03075 [Ignavibacteriota bacterium]
MRAIKYLIVLLLLFSVQSVISQKSDEAESTGASIKTKSVRMIIRTAPKFTLQISGGYNHGIYELSGNDNGDFNSMQFYNGENYGVRHGLGGIITAKIPLHEKGNIRFNVSGMYNKFNSKIIENKDGGFANFNVFSGVLGLENNFTPSYRFKTLIGAGLVASVISGNAHVVNEKIDRNVDIKPAFRLGITFYSGFEYLLNDNMGFNLGYQFTQANLWLKSAKSSNDEKSVYLNDSRVTPRIPYSGWKQFAWGSFYGGLNIYFGIIKKDYVIKNFIK